MLELTGVSKNYGEVQALATMDLRITAGRTTVLIGPSGCGKSTLLHLLAGLIQPDAGAIHFAGTAITPGNINNLRRRMGYVIQEGGLFPHMTVRRNVTLMADYLRWPKERSEQRLQQLRELVHLEAALLQRYPAELSGGQRQRVSLMRALMLDPELLLLDEPLGALDPMIRYELQQELKGIFTQLGKTVVLVTHDIAEAAFFGQQIILMRGGHVVQQGTFQQLAGTPADSFVEQFISAQRQPLQILNQLLS